MLGLGCCGVPHASLVPEGHTELSREQLKGLYDLSLSLNGGKLLVHGIFARANTKNTNRRVYPKAVLKREVKCYKAKHIKAGTALGELDHPSYSSQFFKHLNLPNVSHQVLSVKWRGDELWGTIEILPTPSGLLLWELYSKGIRLGVSSRGWASLVQDQNTRAMVVDDDFELITFDFVTEPSTRGAFLVPICRTYRKNVPDQTPVVQISHMGVGSAVMPNVYCLPTPAALHARMRALQKQQQACHMAVKTAGDLAILPAQHAPLRAPSRAAASNNSPGVLQPLSQHQQLGSEAEGCLLLVSHYSTDQEEPVVQPDPHGRHLPTHLSMFATRAHLADDYGCVTTRSSMGGASKVSSSNAIGSGRSSTSDRCVSTGGGSAGYAAHSCSYAPPSSRASFGKGSSKSHLDTGAVANDVLVANALSRGSAGSASTSGSLRPATPPDSLAGDSEYHSSRMPGCGLKGVLQAQQRVQPQQQQKRESSSRLTADVTGRDDSSWGGGQHSLQLQQQQEQRQQQESLPQQQQQGRQHHQQQQQHQQEPWKEQHELPCSVPGGVEPRMAVVQPGAAGWAAPDLVPPASVGCRQAGVAPPLKQEQQACTIALHAVQQPPPAPPPPPLQQQKQSVLGEVPSRRSLQSQHSRSHSAIKLPPPSHAHDFLRPGLVGSLPYEACRVAVPVAAGACTTNSTVSSQQGGGAVSCHDPDEVDNIKNTLASYKAKCTAAQQELLQVLASQ